MGVSLRPGAVVVLEGLDGAGKSTQIEQMRRWTWNSEPAFAHMPSGLTSLTSQLYQLTERERIGSPLARQLLHLACHSENMPALRRASETTGLVLDRWWWSTLAYGWYGADLASEGVAEDVFLGLIRSVWTPIVADVVLVFSTPFTNDPLNLRGVREGYRYLIEEAGETAFEVPAADPATTTQAIRQMLLERAILIEASTP